MSVVKIFDGENVVFILPHFDEFKKLCELRTQLERDGFTQSNYHFAFGGVRASTIQENILSLSGAATQESKLGDARKILRMDIIGFLKDSLSSEHAADTEQKKRKSYELFEPVKASRFEPDLAEVQHTCEERAPIVLEPGLYESEGVLNEPFQQNLDEQSQNNKVLTVNSCLRPPKPWEVKGIKIYGETEIQNAQGYERTRREYWNKEAKKLSCSTKLSRAEIVKKINQNWRKEKVTIFEEEFQTKLGSGKDGGSLKKKTLERNMARMKNLEEEMLAVDETKISKKNIDSLKLLEKRKTHLLSQMKKAQDSMRKSIRK